MYVEANTMRQICQQNNVLKGTNTMSGFSSTAMAMVTMAMVIATATGTSLLSPLSIILQEKGRIK